MIIEVPGKVWQVIAHIQKVDRPMPKSVLEGMLREMIEHELYRGLTGDDLNEAVGRALLDRGVHLTQVELRSLDASVDARRPGLKPQWWEVLVEDLSTADGFGVTLDVVGRAHLAPEIAGHHGQQLVLRSTLTAGLQVELADIFANLEVEAVMGSRESWTAELLNRLVEGNFDRVLDQFHIEKVGHGHNAGLGRLWVTELKVKARDNAFRPQPQKQRWAGPLGFFSAYVDPLMLRLPDET